MNRRNLIKSCLGPFGLMATNQLLASEPIIKSPEDLEMERIIWLFKQHGYFVPKTKMRTPVDLYDFVKKDIVLYEYGGNDPQLRYNMLSEYDTLLPIEAGSLRYRTIDDIVNWIKLDKTITPNRIFIPYKVGSTPNTFVESNYRPFKYIRGVWFDPTQTEKYKKYYNTNS